MIFRIISGILDKKFLSVSSLIIVVLIIGMAATGCKAKEDHSKPQIKLRESKGGESNLCKKIADVMCYNMFECCTGAAIEKELGIEQSTSEGDCKADMTLLCENSLSFELHAMKEGTIELNKEETANCINALIVPEEGCFPFILGKPVIEDSCSQEFLVGKQAPGDDCLYSVECEIDSYCGADRTCKSLPVLGEPCTGTCASGFYCGYQEGESELVCTAVKTAGQACSQGEPCEDSLYCEFDDEAMAGTCSVKRTVEQSCSEKQPCTEDATCLPGTCDDGSTCYQDADCSGTCEDSGLTCQDSEDCGASCQISGSYCQDDSNCGGSCTLGGGTCSDDWDCHSSGICEDTGSTCFGEFDCASGGVCSITGAVCYGSYGCSEEGEICIPNELCVPNDSDSCAMDSCISNEVCIGVSLCNERICAERYGPLDYCKLGLGAISIIGGSHGVPGGVNSGNDK